MRIIKFYFLLLPFALFVFAACSDTKDNLSSPDSISVHGIDVMNISSSTFHGKILTSKGLTQCRECHANDFSGGTAKVNCAASNCHTGINVHKAGILDSTSPDFHETYIKNKIWDLSLCSQCHGADYSGGSASPSCNTCHTNPGGPEACNTCHGDFSNPAKIAPARAINDATLTTAPQVGAHSTHLYDAKNGNLTACNECHTVPTKLTSAGHIDNDGKAEVHFLSNKTGMTATTGAYDFSTNKCSNIYCHGNFELTKAASQYQFIYSADKMSGLNKQVTWTQVDGTQTACGSCHDLPPAGHVSYAINTCTICHQGIIDAKGKIIDASKHMNGKVNVFSTEY